MVHLNAKLYNSAHLSEIMTSRNPDGLFLYDKLFQGPESKLPKVVNVL